MGTARYTHVNTEYLYSSIELRSPHLVITGKFHVTFKSLLQVFLWMLAVMFLQLTVKTNIVQDEF